jgi:hypothetical protein
MGMLQGLHAMALPLQLPSHVLQVRETEVPHDPAWHVHVYVATPLE